MEGLFALIKRRKRLAYIYLAILFLSPHYFLTAYINSSLLSKYAGAETVSLLYILGSSLNILVFFFFTPLLRTFGNARLIAAFTVIEIAALLGLSSITNPFYLFPVFVLHQALPPLVLFTLDIFLKGTAPASATTGGLRGIFLTLSNITLVFSPLIMSALVTGNDFTFVYLLSAALLLPVLLIAHLSFKKFSDPEYRPLHTLRLARTFLKNRDLHNVFFANLLLQLFYSWMVIYIPIHLIGLGFSWQNIGLIFTFMLLPFVLFELPIGRLADTRFGEKEFMAGGFVVLSLSTALISFINGPSMLLWALLLFVTRIGASFIEITTETYFFKKVAAKESDFMSIFRMTSPLSFIIGPIIGAFALSVFDLNTSFIVFAVILSLGVPLSLQIKDTL